MSVTAVCATKALKMVPAANELRHAAHLLPSLAQFFVFGMADNPSETAAFLFAPPGMPSVAAVDSSSAYANAFPATAAASSAIPKALSAITMDKTAFDALITALDQKLDTFTNENDDFEEAQGNLHTKVNVRVAVPVAFVAVIVYAVAACTVVGVPDNKPVDVLNVKPAGAAGLIA